MNKIGIIFAMEEELNALLNYLELENEYKIFDLTFYECNLDNNKLILVESGIGKVNAARCTQILIDNMEVEYIFNIGVAGSTVKNVKVGDIVLAKKLVQHDFDITAFSHEKGFIPNVGKYIYSDFYLLKIAEELGKNDSTIHKGVIASGDIFCTENKMSNKIAHKFDALCVEMEGASIAQVCFLSHIPFLVIRSISDSPEEDKDNKTSYDKFLETSSKRVANYLLRILKNLE